MNNQMNLLLKTIEREKGITSDQIKDAIEQAIISSYKAKLNTAGNLVVKFDLQTNQVSMFTRKLVVDFVIDERFEILIDDALQINPEVIEEDYINLVFDAPKELNRLAIKTAKEVLVDLLKSKSNQNKVQDLSILEDTIVRAKVNGISNAAYHVLLEDSGIEALLHKNEVTERFKIGDTVTAYVTSVHNSAYNELIISLSRNHPAYLKYVLESFLPALANRNVLLKAIAREPGSRTKIAVYDPNQQFEDVVKEVVGEKGLHIKKIVGMLREKIDVVEWFPEPTKFIQSALSPAENIIRMEFIEDDEVIIIIAEDQLTSAIGAGGQNVRLAAKLTGLKLDLNSPEQAILKHGIHLKTI